MACAGRRSSAGATKCSARCRRSSRSARRRSRSKSRKSPHVARWLAAPAAPAPPDAWRGVGLEAVRSVTAGAERSGVGAVHCVPDAPLYMWGIGRCMLHVARPRRCRLSGACCCHCSAHRPALDAALGRLAPHHRLLVLRVQTGRALHGRYNMPRAAWSLRGRCMVATTCLTSSVCRPADRTDLSNKIAG